MPDFTFYCPVVLWHPYTNGREGLNGIKIPGLTNFGPIQRTSESEKNILLTWWGKCTEKCAVAISWAPRCEKWRNWPLDGHLSHRSDLAPCVAAPLQPLADCPDSTPLTRPISMPLSTPKQHSAYQTYRSAFTTIYLPNLPPRPSPCLDNTPLTKPISTSL